MTTIDPRGLPQKRADRYENVDTSDFSTAAGMSSGQTDVMAQLAESRGESDNALKWKQAAMMNKQAEELAESGDEMRKLLNPNKFTGVPGKPLVEKADDSPWAQDAEYQKLDGEVAEAEAAIEGMGQADPQFSHLSIQLGAVRDRRQARAVEVRQEALDQGVWTETEEMVQSAHESLADKSRQVADLMKGS